MKVLILAIVLLVILTLPLLAKDSTEVVELEEDNNAIDVQEEEQYDFFIDRDGDGICDNRTLRNKSVISQKSKLHHYRIISYKYDYRFKYQFGTPGTGKQGHQGNGGQGNGGHHGGP